jgi:predicted chitinase
MRERGLDLQNAVNTLTDMIAERVQRYASLKTSLPSFGTTVDKEVARYLAELEHETYGSVRWYYESPSTSKWIVSCH